jgi:beta-glucosidase
VRRLHILLPNLPKPPCTLQYTVSNKSNTFIPQIDYDEKLSTSLLFFLPHSQFITSLDIDYRHFDRANITPRYEFGFGLSYTTFTYSDLAIKILSTVPANSMQPGGPSGLYSDALIVGFTVKNTGAHDGNEVAQLYIVRLSLYVA